MSGHIQRNVVAGILTLIPFVVTWIVVDFLLRLLARTGKPAVAQFAQSIQPRQPEVAEVLTNPIVQNVVGVILVVIAVYFLGVFATQVVGRQIRRAFDALMNHIPFVKSIYGVVRRTIDAFDHTADVKRVVLIEFPKGGMKAVGLMTRVLKDETTGEDLATVFIPTTPNPTNGYLEIVPLKDVTPSDWSLDEA
ncbi:MAG: DUF502 domain-containing protein, partial [Pseudomonadota bacterium]